MNNAQNISKPRVRIGINGFGRIGQGTLRAIFGEKYDVEVVAINTSGSTPIESIAYSLKYDSVYGRFGAKIEALEPKKGKELGRLQVGYMNLPILAERDINRIPWGQYGVDVVLECTGAFVDRKAEGHLKNGVKKVVISAPPKGDIPVFVLGVNEDDYKGETLISNGSCTTNCTAPIVKLIDQKIGFEKGMLTTIHAYTVNQSIVDSSANGDMRRARAAAINIVPSTTGAAEAVIACYPEAKGRFGGTAIRVPVPCGSYSDLTFKMVKKTTIEEVNAILEEAAVSPHLVGKLKITYDPIVSSDIIGNSASCLIDTRMTKVLDGDMLQIGAWYDNEYGYSCRLVEMGIFVGKM